MQRVLSNGYHNTQNIQTMIFTPFDDIDESISKFDSEPEVPDVKSQAETIIEQAQNEAQEIVINAQNEAEEIKEKAFQSGYDAGLKVAEKEISETIERMSQVFTNALKELASLKDEIVANAEGDIIELTMAIAKKLVCCELKQHPEFLIDVIKEAIKTSKIENEIIIRINPEDRVILEQYMGELIDFLRAMTFNQRAKIIVEDDISLTQGGCVITTDTNIIDMTYEARLDSIMESITSEQMVEN
ncbi:MAG: flagellar assembly protein FliH [Candidatus Poribacteria bacterium]|nr:flagellar assembly protein FliH [Candidatus Poribacteria bacterium]